MPPRFKDFNINHQVIQVEPTAKMRALADEIAKLQATYRALEEKEQKKQWKEYTALVRERAIYNWLPVSARS